jgi:hypothetical protein
MPTSQAGATYMSPVPGPAQSRSPGGCNPAPPGRPADPRRQPYHPPLPWGNGATPMAGQGLMRAHRCRWFPGPPKADPLVRPGNPGNSRSNQDHANNKAAGISHCGPGRVHVGPPWPPLAESVCLEAAATGAGGAAARAACTPPASPAGVMPTRRMWFTAASFDARCSGLMWLDEHEPVAMDDRHDLGALADERPRTAGCGRRGGRLGRCPDDDRERWVHS